MKDELEILWETHDFAVGKIAILEEEYEFLLANLTELLSEDFASGLRQIIDKIEEQNDIDNELLQEFTKDTEELITRDGLLKRFIQLTEEITSYYNKQLRTIQELRVYYEENSFSIPESRQIGDNSLQDLEEITFHLRDVLNESTESVKNMLTSDRE